MVAGLLCNLAWLCDPCCDPYQLISGMATVNKKRKVDVEGLCFQERWKLQYFFPENLNTCVRLICQETVVMYEEVNVRTLGSDRAEKVKQLEAVLASQHW